MKYQVQENCLTIYLPREVDHHNAEEIKAEADAVIDRNHIRYVIFDFDRTDFMDSSGIGVIMGRYKTISLIGGEVWAVHTNERIRKILTLSGVTKIMQIYEAIFAISRLRYVFSCSARPSFPSNRFGILFFFSSRFISCKLFSSISFRLLYAFQ